MEIKTAFSVGDIVRVNIEHSHSTWDYPICECCKQTVYARKVETVVKSSHEWIATVIGVKIDTDRFFSNPGMMEDGFQVYYKINPEMPPDCKYTRDEWKRNIYGHDHMTKVE